MKLSFFKHRRCLGAVALLIAAALVFHMSYIHVVLFADDATGAWHETFIPRTALKNAHIRGSGVEREDANHAAATSTSRLAVRRSSLPPTLGSTSSENEDAYSMIVPSLNNESSFKVEPMARIPEQTTSAHNNNAPIADNRTVKESFHSTFLQEAMNATSSRTNYFPHRRNSLDHYLHYDHDDTMVPDALPGFFVNNSVYLQSIRLTTSYQSSNQDVHVDLFGFSGDATRPHIEKWDPFCTSIPDNLNHTLLGKQGLQDTITFFCQLDLGQSSDHQRNASRIKMYFVPMSTIDYSQTLGSALWRCNVTDVMNKPQLIQYIDDRLEDGQPPPNVTVHVYMRHNLRTRKRVTRLATFQIPLDTGSLGTGTVHVRRTNNVAKTYFHQPPVSAGLCVAVYGPKPLVYLSQFVQHHLNVGFGSIVVGVKGHANGTEIQQAQKLLQRYIDQGVVSLAHYNSPFTCDLLHGSQVDQMQFYQPCLYHHKGLTKYSATWDIDEFWTPPESLHVDGHHNHSYFQLGYDKIMTSENETLTEPGVTMNASRWSTFPAVVQNDPLWQQSRYAQSVSIRDTLDAIDRYYQQHGCDTSFCFHIFPSYVVWMRTSVNDENRTFLIGKDFEMRKVASDNTWQKSVVNTNYAHMSGIHLPGSCFFEHSLDAKLPLAVLEKSFHAFANTAACNPRRFEHHAYGSIHHWFDLIVSRGAYGGSPSDNVTQADEYVSQYATTVERQLARDDRNERKFSSKGLND